MKNKKNIIITDSSIEEIEDFKVGLSKIMLSHFEIKSHIANYSRKNLFLRFKRIIKYFFVPIHYFFRRKRYDYIVCWQQFYGLIYVFYCLLFRVKKRNFVIAVNFTYKQKSGILGKIYFKFFDRIMKSKYLDMIHVPSNEYAKQISDMFNYPLERIIIAPFGLPDIYDEFSNLPYPVDYSNKQYCLSIGRSNRDFSFLINSWSENFPDLVIISDTFKDSTPLKANVKVFKNITGIESFNWIAHCICMIIPIDKPGIASGDTVLLKAMALKKKILITKPSTLAEMYVDDEINGLCVNKDIIEFQNKLKNLLYNSKYDSLGDNARLKFLNVYSRIKMGENIGCCIKKIINLNNNQ